MSQLFVDNIKNRTGGAVGFPTGVVVTGVATFNNQVSIAGTLTYEDVTNVDSTGIIAAKSGVKVTGGEILVGSGFSVGQAGIVTASGIRVGTAITIDATSGIITAVNGFVGNVTGNATGLSGTPDITVRNVTGVAATFTGVLTYDDVTNVDSLGIVTARSGVEFGASGVGGTITAAGQAEFAGIVTALGVNVSGIVTAASFQGSGADLTNLPASGDSNDITASLFL